MSVGEGSEIKPEEASLFVSPNRQELDMLYGFGPSAIRNETKPDGKDTGIEYSLIALKRMFSDWNKGAGDGWPAIYLGNHDQARLLSRFGKDTGEYREVSSKMLATFLLTMRGTAYWFAGDEIGMDNIKFENISDYKDVDTITNYKRILNEGGDTDAYLEKQKLIARDNARTPFQWDDSPNAGFTTGTPWIKVNPNYKTVNVTAEEQNPDSILNYFKKVIKFRKENEAFVYGDYLLLDAQNPRIYAYQRTWKGERFIVTLNFSPHMAKMDFIADMKNCKAIFCNYNDESKRVKNGTLLLRPFEAVIWK